MVSIQKSKRNIFLIDIFIIIICIAGIYQSAEKAGIELLLSSQNNEVIVKNSENSFRIEDQIIKVDSFSVASLEDIEFILDSHSIGDQVNITILRNEVEINLKTKLVALNSSFYLFSLFLAGTIFLGLGIFVLLCRPSGDKVALIFHWISVTVCIHIMTTFGNYNILPFHLGYFFRIIFFLASSLTPALFLHLSFLFPKEKKLPFKWIIQSMYGLSIISSLIISYLFIAATSSNGIEYFHNFMIVYNYGRWLFAVIMIFGVINFFHSYFKALEESERRKLRWVILGLAIGPLGFIFLWQIPQVLTSAALVPEEVILLISSLTPLAFAISIVRYHILDIDIIFNRSAVYFLVFVIVLLVYAAIVTMSAFILDTFTVKTSILSSAVAAIMIALLFEPARRRVQRFVDKKFFRIRYNYRLAQSEFTQQIQRFYQISSLSRFVIEKLSELLMVEHMGLYILDKDDRWVLSAGYNVSEMDDMFKETLFDFGKRSESPLFAVNRFMEAGIKYESADNTISKQNTIALVVTLRIQNAPVSGFLVFGPKKSGLPFTREDIDLIRTVSSETSFAIERIRMQEELMVQLAETRRLDELNRLKSYFVSSVSHDLQTPLTSIKMFTEILQNKNNISSEDEIEYLDIIQGETDRLSRLISNVLDFSRIERGQMTYTFEKIELISLIKSVLKTMRYQLKQSRFKIETFWPDSISLYADKDALAGTLINLISNSIKYSDKEKYIGISVFLENGYAVICIKDHGIGIAEDEQVKIFDTFYRSQDNRVKTLGGAGLGLTIVQHIIQVHKGKIKVESKQGSGTTFFLYLPIGDKQ
ncbi:PDZ domain-containing protein [candidate division KSB1 bacterium]|nr:PDZ domain-containing protein [candidate division KSB1 bacterium]